MEHHPRGAVQHEIFSNSFPENLDLMGDVLWSVTYILLILVAFRQKTPGIPAVAIALNFTWEVVYTLGRTPPTWTHLVVQLAWLILDCVIVFQVFRYGSRPELTKRHYNLLFLSGIVLAFCGQLVYLKYGPGEDPHGANLAYAINLVMSVTFIGMLFNRSDHKGISIPVAWTKMLATAVITVSVYLKYPSLELVGLMLYLGFCTAICDCYYIYRIYVTRARALAGASGTSGSSSPATA